MYVCMRMYAQVCLSLGLGLRCLVLPGFGTSGLRVRLVRVWILGLSLRAYTFIGFRLFIRFEAERLG